VKRADLAFIVDTRPKRIDVLKERGQLPFRMPESGRFTLDHAFRLRLMLDLLGGEDDGLGGLAPSDAAPLVERIMGQFPHRPLGIDFWAAVALFEAYDHDIARRFSVAFCGHLEDIPKAVSRHAATTSPRPRVLRIVYVNAWRAAEQVKARAFKLGFSEGGAHKAA
jgi:hypothetical protein